VSGIAGVTKNAVAFTNAGQFALSGTGLLVVNPSLITQPAVGVTDTYVVTMNNSSGLGTTLATVVVSHGSTKIDSIVMSDGTITPSLTGFNAISKTYGDAAFSLTAPTTVSSGAFTYTSSNTAVATISGSTVTVVGAGTSTITATQAANGNYATASTTATLTVGLPSGYIVSGGLTWAPITTRATWSGAASTCMASTALGGTWRQPTEGELSALYAAYPNNSATLNALGWTLDYTWSSTDNGAGFHYGVYLNSGFVGWASDRFNFYVSCVH
jgi:hypothetical protein